MGKNLIYVNLMVIYVNITDRQTDKHVKSIVRNLTKFKKKMFFYKWSIIIVLGSRMDCKRSKVKTLFFTQLIFCNWIKIDFMCINHFFLSSNFFCYNMCWNVFLDPIFWSNLPTWFVPYGRQQNIENQEKKSACNKCYPQI